MWVNKVFWGTEKVMSNMGLSFVSAKAKYYGNTLQKSIHTHTLNQQSSSNQSIFSNNQNQNNHYNHQMDSNLSIFSGSNNNRGSNNQQFGSRNDSNKFKEVHHPEEIKESAVFSGLMNKLNQASNFIERLTQESHSKDSMKSNKQRITKSENYYRTEVEKEIVRLQRLGYNKNTVKQFVKNDALQNECPDEFLNYNSRKDNLNIFKPELNEKFDQTFDKAYNNLTVKYNAATSKQNNGRKLTSEENDLIEIGKRHSGWKAA